MADNLTLDAGAGGATLAADDIGGIHYQRIKVTFGADGAATDASSSNPLPVDIGSGATGAAKAEDAAAASGDVGVPMLTVRQDTPASSASADGDYQHAKSDSAGRLYVNASGVAVPITDNSGSLTVDNAGTFAVQAAQSGTWNVADGGGSLTVDGTVAVSGSVATTNAGTFVTQENGAALTALQLIDNLVLAEDVAHASGDPGVLMLAVRRDTVASSSGTDGDNSTLNVNASGRLYTSATVDTALPAGTNNIGDVDVLTLPGAAHDAAIAGNPVRTAGRARTSDYTSVANDDTADLLCTLNGKQVVQQFAIPENSWSYAAASGGIVNTTGVTVKAAAAAGIRNYITHVDVVNGHATVDTDVQIRDGAAGTVLWRGFAKAAGGGVSANFDPPLRGTAATLVEVACGTTGTATYFNLTGYTGP